MLTKIFKNNIACLWDRISNLQPGSTPGVTLLMHSHELQDKKQRIVELNEAEKIEPFRWRKWQTLQMSCGSAIMKQLHRPSNTDVTSYEIQRMICVMRAAPLLCYMALLRTLYASAVVRRP